MYRGFITEIGRIREVDVRGFSVHAPKAAEQVVLGGSLQPGVRVNPLIEIGELASRL